MADIYIGLTYAEYKGLEEQMRHFRETTHRTEPGFYHKSIRLDIAEGVTMEFHGPLVMAGQAAILEPEEPHTSRKTGGT